MPFGWIDFSKTERNKVLTVLDLLIESATLDELGIAPIRDGFSDLFFPGTSTIQTRAKYFFLVPYALRELEQNSEMNPNRMLIALDAKEKACAEELVKQNAVQYEDGIIGKVALANNKWVKRTPADIYWAGLRRYGIFLGGKMSLSEYVRSMCAIKNQRVTIKKLGNRNDQAEEQEKDDADAGKLNGMRFWKVPTYRKDWFQELTINLTSEEGTFLKEQILYTCPNSMMALILKHNKKEILEYSSFRDLEEIMDNFPEAMQQDYHLALDFSEFIYTIRTVYNVIVFDGENELAEQELQELKPRFNEIASINVDEIMNRLNVLGNEQLRMFLKQAQKAMKENNVEALKKHIKDREIYLKGQSRAKTCHPGQFTSDWVGGKELDYRFYNAKRILQDIFQSEEEPNNAESE